MTAPQKVPNVGTSYRAALAFFNNRLYLSWRDVDTDERTYRTSFGQLRAAQQTVPHGWRMPWVPA